MWIPCIYWSPSPWATKRFCTERCSKIWECDQRGCARRSSTYLIPKAKIALTSPSYHWRNFCHSLAITIASRISYFLWFFIVFNENVFKKLLQKWLAGPAGLPAGSHFHGRKSTCGDTINARSIVVSTWELPLCFKKHRSIVVVT